MSAILHRDSLREIREKIDLVELIQEYVPLKKAGVNYLGLCPFHQETKPSFTVNPRKQIFHCFGCQAGGSAFDFVMRAEGLDFPAALRALAKRAGVELSARASAEDKRREEERERLLAVNGAAQDFFRGQLSDSRHPKATTYLQRRKVAPAEAERFGLGYAPPGWEGLSQHLRRKKIPGDLALTLGLLSRGPNGLFDRFRDRLMFPIRNARGELIGFGGRTLGDDEAKYLNSPETPLFSKGRNLYGLKEAAAEIRRRKYAFVVEGYLDCISMSGAGFENTVAPLGTALTEEQVRLLKRYADSAVIVFDGDAAGRGAILRSLTPCLRQGLDAEMILLPEGQDPDSLLKAEGTAAFQRCAEARRPLLDFYLQTLFPADAPPAQKAAALKALLEVVAGIGDPLYRGFVLQKIAAQTRLSEGLLQREMKSPATPGVPEAAPAKAPAEEAWLLLLMAEDAALRGRVQEEGILDHFADPRTRRIGDWLLGHDPGAGAVSAAALLAEVEDPGLRQVLCAQWMEGENRDAAEREKILRDCLRALQKKNQSRLQRELNREIVAAEKAGDRDKLRQLLGRKRELMRDYHEKT